MDTLLELAVNSSWHEYVIAFCLMCRVFVTLAPPSLTAKIPDLAMEFINKCALASRKDVDSKGNLK